METFTTVVVGDEPAGLWLLRELYEVGIPGGKPSLGWVPIQERSAPVALSVSAAKAYKIPEADVWYPEIWTPHHRLSWEPSQLAQMFPGLPQPGEALRPSAVRKALHRHPEILAYASGLWKYLGRTSQLQPENLVLAAIEAAGLVWWDPVASLPEGVERLAAADAEHPIESIRRERSGWAIRFKGRDAPIVAERWLFNVPLHVLRWLTAGCKELAMAFPSVLEVHRELRSPQSEFGLEVSVAPKGIPFTVRPLTILFDTDEIPDPIDEIWPIERRQSKLTIWASAQSDPSLEGTLDKFRLALQRLHRLFPFLGQAIEHLSVPLDMDTCSSPEDRERTLAFLETGMRENYRLSRLIAETRHPAVHALLPCVNCHLPYPLGTLSIARRYLIDWVGKKRLKEHAAQAPAEGTSASS